MQKIHHLVHDIGDERGIDIFCSVMVKHDGERREGEMSTFLLYGTEDKEICMMVI